ncbi:hypothetical protein LguiA_013040 [Lonicera macranthoides]
MSTYSLVIRKLYNVLKAEGTENIEGIRLHFPERKYINIGAGAFRKMDKLRLVEIRNACVPRGPEYLSDQLRWLDWDEFPSKSMPPRFQPENLVGLRLHFSSIILLWNGKKSIILPGREILPWFCNQSLGSSISLKLPPNCLNNKFRGVGITAVFDSITKARTYQHSSGEKMKYLDVKFMVIVPPIECDVVLPFSKMTHKSIDSEHVCLAYLRFYDFQEFNRMDTSPSDWREIEVSIDSQGQSVAVVKKWGIRLVYEDDIKQMI